MIVVVSQPMLFPWVGLLEQMHAADIFVHYSDVQYSRGSFVNRVQIKTAHGMRWLTVPTRGRRLGQKINEVKIDEEGNWRQRHLQILRDAYEKAPNVNEMLKLVETVYAGDYQSIGELSEASELALCRYFGISSHTSFLSSKKLKIEGAGTRRVLDIVLALGGNIYLTGHGAKRYLDHEEFEQAGIRVQYMDYARTPYRQMHGDFTPYVSALDLIANVGSSGRSFIHPRSIYWKDYLSEHRN